MKWQRIETGHYRSVSPKTYTITKEGVGLFTEGWRPSWNVRRNGGAVLGEYASLKNAKVGAENVQKVTRMGRKRLLARNIQKLQKNYPAYITAIHEAGHILVEWMTSNRHIISATCVPSDNCTGYVHFRMAPGDSVDAKMAKGMIMVGLAGDVAETLVTKNVFEVKSLNDTDRSDLLNYGPDLCGGRELDGFAMSLAEETLELLLSNEEPLMLLAHTLRRMGNLDSRQIRCLRRRLDLVLPETTAA